MVFMGIGAVLPDSAGDRHGERESVILIIGRRDRRTTKLGFRGPFSRFPLRVRQAARLDQFAQGQLEGRKLNLSFCLQRSNF